MLKKYILTISYMIYFIVEFIIWRMLLKSKENGCLSDKNKG